MAGGARALVNGYGQAFLMKHDIEIILSSHIPMVSFTCSRKAFEVITRSKQATGRRVMVVMPLIPEAYTNSFITNIGISRSQVNARNALTRLLIHRTYLS